MLNSLRKISQLLLLRNVARKYSLTADNVNPHMKNIEYALLGPLVMRALELQKEIDGGAKKDFDEVLLSTAGDNQASGQKPVTLLRQVLALCSYSELFDDPSIPQDVKKRARKILSGCTGNSVGAYGYQAGINTIRENIVNYIEKRDNLQTDIDNIIVTTGASEGMDYMLHMASSAMDGKSKGGVMLPIPVYLLYIAYMARYNNYTIRYYLDEENDWSLSETELERSYNEGLEHSIPRLLVAINPGNPTGNVLKRSDIETIIDFAKKKNLPVLADEVYQGNVYGDTNFLSFKRVLHDLGSDYKDVELVSLMSASKGVYGECGLRGGYMELLNVNPKVKNMLLTNLSLRTCAPTLGQAAVDVVVNPPVKGDESYELFEKETTEIYKDQQKKAKLVTEELNKIPGYSCNQVRGSIYAFAKVDMPTKAIEAAEKKGVPPDVFYCQQLLEKQGVCIVPGSPFQQLPGTHHVRLTISPSSDTLKRITERMRTFHDAFLEEYS